MKNRGYKVSRANIFAGNLVKAESIYRHKGDYEIFHIKTGQLITGNCYSYRSILFVPNEKKLANDLLYNSPSYPILNVTDDDICLGLNKGSIVIKDACNLEALLKYFDYNKELTFEDIMRIRKTFFTGKFAKDHCKLFGYKETMAEDLTFYSGDKEITSIKEIKKQRKQFKSLQKCGIRFFKMICEGLLPREYWYLLDQMGDSPLLNASEWDEEMNSYMPLMDFFNWHEKMDVFKPDKEEVSVQKLKKF